MTKQSKTQIAQAAEQVAHVDPQNPFEEFLDAMGLGQPQFSWQRTACAFLLGVFAGSCVATLGVALIAVASAAVLPVSVWLSYFISVFGWALTLLATFYVSSRAAQWWLTGQAADVVEDKVRAAKDKVVSLFKRNEQPATVH